MRQIRWLQLVARFQQKWQGINKRTNPGQSLADSKKRRIPTFYTFTPPLLLLPLNIGKGCKFENCKKTPNENNERFCSAIKTFAVLEKISSIYHFQKR